MHTREYTCSQELLESQMRWRSNYIMVANHDLSVALSCCRVYRKHSSPVQPLHEWSGGRSWSTIALKPLRFLHEKTNHFSTHVCFPYY